MKDGNLAQNQAALLLRHSGGAWNLPEVASYTNEEMLKHLLREAPQLLSMCKAGTVFVDELTVPGIGSVDLVGVSPGGEITLIECKLESNPEIRREVIGQIFSYAAGLAGMSYEEFDRRFHARSGGQTLADAVGDGLAQVESQTWMEENFRENVSENLNGGRFTLIVAVDRITDELKIVVPYINNHTAPDVRFLALELGYVRDGDVEIVIPLVYGEESADEKQRRRRGTAWPVAAYFEKLQSYRQSVQDAINALVTFSEEHGAELVGGSGLGPSLNVRFSLAGSKRTVWSSYFQAAGPTFDLNYEYLRDVIAFEALKESARILGGIDGAADRFAKINGSYKERPSLAIDGVLAKPGAPEVVMRALEVLLNGKISH